MPRKSSGPAADKSKPNARKFEPEKALEAFKRAVRKAREKSVPPSKD